MRYLYEIIDENNLWVGNIDTFTPIIDAYHISVDEFRGDMAGRTYLGDGIWSEPEIPEEVLEDKIEEQV